MPPLPPPPIRYLAGKDGWLKADVRQESLRVAGGGATTVIEVVVTRHGPVVEGDPRRTGVGLAAKMTGLLPEGTATLSLTALDLIP